MEEMPGLLSGSHVPCPPLPGLMEKSISASQCCVPSAREGSQQDRPRAAACFSRALETEPLTEASCSLQGVRIWAFAISPSSSLNGPEPACFHDYVFEQEHICVRGVTRQQRGLSAWISVDPPSLGLQGQGREWGVRRAGPSRWAGAVSAAPALGQWLALHIKDQCGGGSNHSQKASSFPQKPENKGNLNNSGKFDRGKFFQLNKKEYLKSTLLF